MLKTERAERMLNLYDIAVIPPHVPYRFAAAAAEAYLTVCMPGEQLPAETARLLPAGHPLTLLFSGSARAQAVFHWLPAPEEVQRRDCPAVPAGAADADDTMDHPALSGLPIISGGRRRFLCDDGAYALSADAVPIRQSAERSCISESFRCLSEQIGQAAYG